MDASAQQAAKGAVTIWQIGIFAYALLAFSTFVPVLVALFRPVRLHPGGPSFDESPHFSAGARVRLQQHFQRLEGTLAFWKNEANKYKAFHYYCILWTIPSSVLVPILAQTSGNAPHAKGLLILVSTHTAILVALNQGLKVGQNFRAFRQGESEFYDLYRQLLDCPSAFGKSEDEQLSSYFDRAAQIRKYVRNAETDNTPSMDHIKEHSATKG